MTRIKPKNSITTREAAEAAMGHLNNLDMDLATWDLAEAREIAEVRERHAEKQKMEGRASHEDKKALIVKELEEWAQGDVAHWLARTIETPFGRFGFRTGNPAVALYKTVAKKLDEALERLSARMPDFVRMRPEIDKEKILAADREGTLDREKLLRCGLRVDQKEEFWVETQASKELEQAAKALKNA